MSDMAPNTVGHRETDHLRIMGLIERAVYEVKDHEDVATHFGLARQAYLHFTSPIRRYPDLTVHRAIRACLAGKRYTPKDTGWEALGMHCSMTERRADEATRDVMAWLKCEYMSDRVGESIAQPRFQAALQLHHVTSIPSSHGQGLRIGCEWARIDGAAQRALQRYIDQTQKRRRLLSQR